MVKKYAVEYEVTIKFGRDAGYSETKQGIVSAETLVTTMKLYPNAKVFKVEEMAADEVEALVAKTSAEMKKKEDAEKLRIIDEKMSELAKEKEALMQS